MDLAALRASGPGLQGGRGPGSTAGRIRYAVQDLIGP